MIKSYIKTPIFVAAFCASIGVLDVANAKQPSVFMTDANGRPIGGETKTIPVKVTGTVVDAATGQPLPVFYLTTGELDRDRTSFDWSEKTRQPITRGVFVLTLNKERMPPAVMIEADGYLPQCSGPIRALETNLTFRLQKGNGPEGVILTPDGHPAATRTVYLTRQKDRDLVFLEGPKLTPKVVSPRVRTTNTDQAGRFSFPPSLDDFAVVVADEAGFADVRIEDLKASPEVRLRPWARVEGTLKIGGQPGSNETVRLADAFAEYVDYPRHLPPYSIMVETTTDNAGRFVFPRVAPVDVKIFHAPKVGQPETMLIPITQITNLSLKAGETRAVTLGGQGRAVIGRAVLKNYDKPAPWQDEVFWIESISPTPSDCPNYDAISREYHAARNAAKTQEDIDRAESRYLAEHDYIARQLRAYNSSPEGRRYWFSKRRYVLRFAEDGSFRIDDVPGGKYELAIDLREWGTGKGQEHMPLIDLHRQEIDVPECPTGRCDTPLDLGAIRMVAQTRPGVPAPAFTAQGLDGKPVSLSDYKGKYLLLNFWASSNEPSADAMPDLKDTYTSFKTNAQFAMLGLSLDTNTASARAFVKENHLDWPQALLGQPLDSDVPERFGVETLPSVILIDPEGKVFAAGLRGGWVKATVDTALSAHE